MNFTFYIARRYLFSRSSNNAINIITIIAASGVFAGAFSLLIVLSGFSGLRAFSLSFSNEYDPDLKVIPEKGKIIKISRKQKEELQQITGLKNYSTVIEERVFLDFKDKNKTAFIKGVDENFLRVNSMDSALVNGFWFDESMTQVVIGNNISTELSLGTFVDSELLKIIVPRPGTGQVLDPTDAFNSKLAIVSGIYSINEELDHKYVYTPINFARHLLEMKNNEISALEIQLEEGADPENVSIKIKSLFNQPLETKNRAQLNESLYKMLNTENLAVYLIFTLVLIIALFNVIGSLTMVIIDKKENIKTLHSLGATPVQLRNIFLSQGFMMSFIGGMIGICVATVVIYLQLQFSFLMITPTLPYPVAITWENILLVISTITVLAIAASFLAANRINNVLQS